MPIDFVALMDVPQMIDEWYQSIKNMSMDLSQNNRVPLTADDLLHNNYKRYFSACELLNGNQLFVKYGLDEDKYNGSSNQDGSTM
jgi:hypothetical protein